jgi:hypothetical protein
MEKSIMSHEIISNINPTIMMSSKDIADLTGKAHTHVIRDVRVMLSAIYGDEPKMVHEQNQGVMEYKDERGYTSEFKLDYDHTLTLVAGYDANLRFKIVKRWRELEASNMRPLTTMEMVAQIALKAVEQERIAAEHEAKLIQHEARLAKTEEQIKDIVDTEQWFTARAAGILYNRRHMTSSQVQKLGKALFNKSREMGVEIIKRPHKDYGEVGTYHIDVIREVFEVDNFQF